MTLSQTISLKDADMTAALGAWVGSLLGPGDFVALTGDLGTGKTTLARGLITEQLRRAGAPAEPVQSPTFNLVQPYYAGDLEIWHYDLYRIDSSAELEELGLDEALDVGCAICEWPDRLDERLPADRLEVALEMLGTQRRAALRGWGTFQTRLETAWASAPFGVQEKP